jgi:hypothetical protein
MNFPFFNPSLAAVIFFFIINQILLCQFTKTSTISVLKRNNGHLDSNQSDRVDDSVLEFLQELTCKKGVVRAW